MGKKENNIPNEEIQDQNLKDSTAEKSKNDRNEMAGKSEIDEKDLKIEILEKELNDCKDKILRKAAEFENFKRRTENDWINQRKYAAENFISKLLPVVDDFERSLSHLESSNDLQSIIEGIKMIYDKLMKMLESQGVMPIEAKGKEFDVNFHEAVMQVKADNAPPHTVVNEVEKGYLYKDRVIRHSKVIVSEDITEQSATE